MMNQFENIAPQLKFWVGNLGKYNEGELIGEWFEAPINFTEVAARIGLNADYEEYYIGDHEQVIQGIDYSSFTSIDSINELQEELTALYDEYGVKLYHLIAGYAELYEPITSTNDLSAIESLDDSAYIITAASLKAACYELAAEMFGVLEGESNHIKNYFDFEGYCLDEYGVTTLGYAAETTNIEGFEHTLVVYMFNY